VQFVPIDHFPDYYINEEGIVINSATGRDMTLSPTENGDLTVGLMRNGVQHRRSVKGIVARTFVDGYTDIFNTPIQLDGNKDNLHASNIVWRPRWFAWKYARQFVEPHPDWYYDGPIKDVNTSIRYHTIFEAAIYHGLLCIDIYECMRRDEVVFPTAQRFRYMR
jgi:hypothetical protein